MELLVHRVIIFLIFLRNYHIAFHSCPTNLHSHQQGTQLSLYTHLFSVFLVVTLLMCVSWQLTVATTYSYCILNVFFYQAEIVDKVLHHLDRKKVDHIISQAN